MAINEWELYIKCPHCGEITTEYDYHENTSSDRVEFFEILNLGGKSPSSFTCKCGKEAPYETIFTPEYCHVENLEKYKKTLRRYIQFADRNGRVSFSDWSADYGEEPALTHLINMYPDDTELKKIKYAYSLLHTYGKRAVTKCELNVKTVCRENILVPESLSKVYLGDNVEIIAPHTFENCEALKDIFMPGSVKKIGEYAFAYSGLSSIHTSDAIAHIGARAFAHTWISKFFFPQNIEEIGEECFADCCYLNNLWIPRQVFIRKDAFIGCYSLRRIQIHRSVLQSDINTWGLCENCVIERYDD